MTRSLTSRQRKSLKTLAIILIILGIGVIAYPFFPIVWYKINPPEEYYPFPSKLSKANPPADTSQGSNQLPEIASKEPEVAVNEQGIPLENYLVIPKIGVNMPIFTSDNEDWALSRGAWHLNTTGNPESGSNMVISAHRFRYRPPSSKTFYLLDKIAVGDQFIIYWNQQEYDYKVTETKIVESTDASILELSGQEKVTLYTCTPLFTTEKRLVVIGEPL